MDKAQSRRLKRIDRAIEEAELARDAFNAQMQGLNDALRTLKQRRADLAQLADAGGVHKRERPCAYSSPKDLVGFSAEQAAKRILLEKGDVMHVDDIVGHAIRRGYRARKGEVINKEVRKRYKLSFWAVLSRSDEVVRVGKGFFRLKGE